MGEMHMRERLYAILEYRVRTYLCIPRYVPYVLDQGSGRVLGIVLLVGIIIMELCMYVYKHLVVNSRTTKQR